MSSQNIVTRMNGLLKDVDLRIAYDGEERDIPEVINAPVGTTCMVCGMTIPKGTPMVRVPKYKKLRNKVVHSSHKEGAMHTAPAGCVERALAVGKRKQKKLDDLESKISLS